MKCNKKPCPIPIRPNVRFEDCRYRLFAGEQCYCIGEGDIVDRGTDRYIPSLMDFAKNLRVAWKLKEKNPNYNVELGLRIQNILKQINQK